MSATQGPSPKGGGPVPRLSDREVFLLRQVAAGHRYRTIGPRLRLSTSGVQSLASRMMWRLGASSMAEVLRIAEGLGMFTPPVVELPQPLLDVLALLAEGRTNRQIAQRLGRSQHTVESQILDLRRRLHARDRAHAAALGVELYLVQVPIPEALYLPPVDAA